MREISTSQQRDAILRNPAAMLKFSAEWCGPCKAVAPTVDRLAGRFPSVESASIDIDKSQDLAREYGVSSVPTFIFFRRGVQHRVIRGGDVPGIEACYKELASASKMPVSGGRALGSEAGASHTASGSRPNRVFAAYPGGLLQNIAGWVWLYLRTLFSFDPRGAAAAAAST